MEGITIDQFNAAFGEFRIPLEQQTSLLSKIERVVTEKLDRFSDRIASVKVAINDLATITAAAADQQTGAINVVIAGQNEQIEHAERLQKTVQDGLKAISSSFVAKDAPQKETDRKNDPLLRQPSKAEKQSIKGILGVETKIGALLKEIQGLRIDEDSRSKGGILGSVFGFLGPLLTVVGGFAALSYAAMAYGPTRQFLQDVQKNGLGVTIKNLASKLSLDKIKNFLRGMPVVGRLFDVYDAFESFMKGDWKMGLKHLTFALPFGEDIINILGGTSKQQFLAPGGVQAFEKGFSLEGAWKRLKEVVSKGFDNLFHPIMETYDHLKEAFGLFGEGTESGIKNGWATLAKYFPILTPITTFFTGLTQDIFEGEFGKKVKERVGPGKDVKLGDIIESSLKSVYDGVTKLFDKILSIFMTTGKVLVAIGDLFGGDYGKQSAALNFLDDAAPPVAGMLRPIMNLMDSIRSAGIEPGDSATEQAWKLMKAATKTTFGAGSTKFSQSTTQTKQISDIQEKLATMPEGADKEKLRQEGILLSEKQIKGTYSRDAETIARQIEAIKKDMAIAQPLMDLQKEEEALRKQGWTGGSFDDYSRKINALQEKMRLSNAVSVSTGSLDAWHVKDYYEKKQKELEEKQSKSKEIASNLEVTKKNILDLQQQTGKTIADIQEQAIYSNKKTNGQALDIGTTSESLVNIIPQPTVFTDTMGNMNDTLDGHSTYLKDIAIEARKQTTGIKDLIEAINKNLSNVSSPINVVNASSWSLNTQQSTSRDTRRSFSDKSYGQ
jgi:hypothetical protein